MFGASFNTTIPIIGDATALSGELAFYPDMPFQLTPGSRRTEALHGQIYTLSTLTPSDPIVRTLGGSLLILVGNAGFQYLPDAEGNRFAIPRSGETHANPGSAATYGDNCNRGGTCSVAPQYATSFSWGYRLLARMEYPSAFGTAYTLSPRIIWSHDVDGYSAGPIGPGFVEGKMAATVGVTASYLDAYSLALDYTNNFGAEYRNGSFDKDFASLTASYMF